MALRLRKDVQKASYYVWFLGAEEARGLRGPRVLLPAITHLLERSREHEPLKVTLQVSHKGMKIVQGSSKHFITHSAITCSLQTEDIVACVLLLYNPTTKCPLHVHAYRCDSEQTAQALNQLLQVLINRPENQKRFTELESRLGLAQPPTAAIKQQTPQQPVSQKNQTKQQQQQQLQSTKSLPLKNQQSKHNTIESSLGSSDTGTSTRESECSEEHIPPISPLSPLSPLKASIFDSLAAELRAKLNGNGPPLLLPPRDYDTVHRSKGNLAATELRRCRNQLIVGSQTGPSAASITKKVVSSRGSSGIGSDLAPSPERHDAHSSSDDEWIHQKNPDIQNVPEVIRRTSGPRPISVGKDFPQQQQIQQPKHMKPFQPPPPPQQQYYDNDYDNDDGPPSYLYPKEQIKQKYIQSPLAAQSVQKPQHQDLKRAQRSSSREEERITTSHISQYSQNSNEEEEIKPIITRPRTFESRFKEVLLEDQRHINDRSNLSKTKQPVVNENLSSSPHHHQHQQRFDKMEKYDKRYVQPQSQQQQPQPQQYRDGPTNDFNVDVRQHQRYNKNVIDHENDEVFYHQNLKKSTSTKYCDDEFIDDGCRNMSADHIDHIEKENVRYRENLTDKQKQKISQTRYGGGGGGGGVEKTTIPDNDHYRHNSRNRYDNNKGSPEHHVLYPPDDMIITSSTVASSTPPLVKEKTKMYRQHSMDINNNNNNNIISTTTTTSSSAVVNKHTDKLKIQPKEFIRPIAHHRNPYQEQESLPYLESIETMIKSPVMRYKSFDDDTNFNNIEIVNNNHKNVHKVISGYSPQAQPTKYRDSDREYNYRENKISMSHEQLPLHSSPKQRFDHHDNDEIDNVNINNNNNNNIMRRRRQQQQHQYDEKLNSTSYIRSPPPPESISKISPKDRFQDAKEKFQAMERDRNFSESKSKYRQSDSQHRYGIESSSSSSPMPLVQSSAATSAATATTNMGNLHVNPYNYNECYSSEDEEDEDVESYARQQQQQQQQHRKQPPLRSTSSSNPREISYNNKSSHNINNNLNNNNERYSVNLDHSPVRRITTSKSIGNLVKGYRHSYAEPRNPAPMPPRSSGRVGLAAVNPY